MERDGWAHLNDTSRALEKHWPALDLHQQECSERLREFAKSIPKIPRSCRRAETGERARGDGGRTGSGQPGTEGALRDGGEAEGGGVARDAGKVNFIGAALST